MNRILAKHSYFISQRVYVWFPIINQKRALAHQEIRLLWFLEILSFWVYSNLDIRYLMFMMWAPNLYSTDLMKNSSCTTDNNAEQSLWWDMLSYFFMVFKCMGKGLGPAPAVSLLKILWRWKAITPHPSTKARIFDFDPQPKISIGNVYVLVHTVQNGWN